MRQARDLARRPSEVVRVAPERKAISAQPPVKRVPAAMPKAEVIARVTTAPVAQAPAAVLLPVDAATAADVRSALGNEWIVAESRNASALADEACDRACEADASSDLACTTKKSEVACTSPEVTDTPPQSSVKGKDEERSVVSVVMDDDDDDDDDDMNPAYVEMVRRAMLASQQAPVAPAPASVGYALL